MNARITSQHLMRALALVLVGFALALIFVPGSSAQTDTVIINELVPRNTAGLRDNFNDPVTGTFEDWIELRNVTGAAISLNGWSISDAGAAWPFPATASIPANGYLLVWASDKGDPFDDDFPGPAGELHANFKLSAVGDSVTLNNGNLPGNPVIDTFTYTAAIGDDESYGRDSGGTFVVFETARVTPLGPNPDPVAPTPPAPPGPEGLVINELMLSNDTTISDGQLPDPDFEDWIELYNPTCATVDLTGWDIRDSANSWPFPAGTSVAPGELLFIWASDKGDINDADFPGPPGELHANFRLSSSGESVFLVDGAGLLIDQVDAPAVVTDNSYGLVSPGSYEILTGASVTANALNPGQTPQICPTATPEPTPGGPAATPTPTSAPTGCASQVRINEVQSRNQVISDGDGDTSDWIELFNPESEAVDLAGWTIRDSSNSWTLPAGASIDAQGFVLIWASDKGDPDDPGFPGPAGELHANFRLGGDGETVTLIDPFPCVVSQVVVPPLNPQQSFGVLRDGSLGIFNRGKASPLRANGDQEIFVEPECYLNDGIVRINRIVAKNDGLAVDGDGDPSDFIELSNRGFDPYGVSTWSIKDSSERWVIPSDTVIPGYGTVVIWASGKGELADADYPGPAGELHANFKLASEGEEVTLFETGGCIADQVTYPELDTNQAYGFDIQGQPGILEASPGTGQVCAAPGSVRIVAAQAKNETTRTDEDGEFGDWLELRNTTTETIDLTGWVLADDGSSWVVPEGVEIAAESDLVVWADEKNRGGDGAAPHTNFKLGSGGETISLGSSSECPVDELSYPELDDDQIWQLRNDGAFALAGAPTPDSNDDDKDADAPAAGDITVVGTCVAITEVMAKNDATLSDSTGEFGDWIEITNLSDDVVDLSGYEISDEKDSWAIPDGTEIGPGEFLLLWADEEDTDSGGELHTNFKLGGDGEPVTLLDADGEVAASLSSYPELDDDESFGINADGDYVVHAPGDATPGEGPSIEGGCDFEVGAANATAGSSGGSDQEDATEEDSDASDGEATESSESAAAAANLARTGTNAGTQSLLAQILLLSGLALMAMAQIARRRSVGTV